MRCRQWIFGGVFVSDCFLKIVPREPVYKIPVSLLTEAKKFLESKLSCDCIEIEWLWHTTVHCCGSNLERIVCPLMRFQTGFWLVGGSDGSAWGKSFSLAGNRTALLWKDGISQWPELWFSVRLCQLRHYNNESHCDCGKGRVPSCWGYAGYWNHGGKGAFIDFDFFGEKGNAVTPLWQRWWVWY